MKSYPGGVLRSGCWAIRWAQGTLGTYTIYIYNRLPLQGVWVGETPAFLGEKEVVRSRGVEPKREQTARMAVRFERMLSWASVVRGQSCSVLDALGHLDLQVFILI